MSERGLLLAVTRAPGLSPGGRARTLPARPASTSPQAALAVLTLIYVLNIMDRSIVTILLQPMGEEFRLHDWQLGLLSGLAFAAVSTTLGLRIARLAERVNRVKLIAASLVCWSVMTALCGRATGFPQLLLCRMGVGIGEAGALPASHSIIADHFLPERRATAHAIFGMGLPIGGLLGISVGGVVADLWGWRQAFIVAGLPGFAVALVLAGTHVLREPARGRFDPLDTVNAEVPPLGAVLTLLWRRRTARHALCALTLSVLVGNASASFAAAFLVRQFGFSYSFVALIMGVTNFAPAIAGVLASGILADRLARGDRRWYMWMPAAALLIGIPFQLLAYNCTEWLPMAALLIVPGLCAAAYMAPTHATLQNIAEPRMRATVTAIATLCTSLVGMGIGPLLGGLSIDLLSSHALAAAGHGDFTRTCHGLQPAGELARACHAALVGGTRAALMLWAPLMAWPAAHYLIAARTIRADLPR